MPKKIQRRIQAPRGQAAGGAAGGGPTGIPGLGETKKKRPSLFARGVSAKALADFTSQFATLIEAGIPVVKSLRILEGQMKPGVLQSTVAQIAEDVESGTPLSEAMAKEPAIFDDLYTNMVRAGEAGGIQDQILDRLSVFLEKAEEIKARVKGAMTYPIAVVIIGVLVIGLVMIVVIPEFKEIFQRLLRSDLPPITQAMTDASDFMVAYWWVWFIAIPALVGLHFFMVSRLHGYRRWRDATRLKLPVVGKLMHLTIVARFARTFGTLIQSGVPHLDALDIVRASTGNVVIQEALDAIMTSIKEGEGIARPMGETGMFDDLIVNMVDVGEQTGELDRMLVRIADRYETQVDRAVDAVIKVMEILIIIVLAGFVALVVAALLAPMVKLMQSIGSGR
jgi:type IV pilus assembly protein PilC